MTYTLSTLLGAFIMFGIPGLLAWGIRWNQRRLVRARRYRAVHGTPWWIPETNQAQLRRQYMDRYKDRMEALGG